MQCVTALTLAVLLAAPLAAQAPDAAPDEKTYNVSMTTLGATATGSGAHFNKDWPALNALRPGNGGGTIFIRSRARASTSAS